MSADVVVIAPVPVADRLVGAGLGTVEIVDAEAASFDEGAVPLGGDGDPVDGLLFACVVDGRAVHAAELVIGGGCRARHDARERGDRKHKGKHETKPTLYETPQNHGCQSLSSRRD